MTDFYVWKTLSFAYYTLPLVIIYFFYFRKQSLPAWGAIGVSTLIIYFLAQFSIDAKWDYRVWEVNQMENATHEDHMRAVADGMNTLFWLYAGWLPALIYSCLCYFLLRLAFLINAKWSKP